MQRRIEFTATGSSALVGNFSSGDAWRGPEDHCAHLVEVHGCAKWADVVEQAAAAELDEQPAVADQVEQTTEQVEQAAAEPAVVKPATSKKKGGQE